MSRLFAGTQFDIPPTCDRCGKLENECLCKPMPEEPVVFLAAEKQTAKVRVDRRKNNRLITVVWGLCATESDLPALLSKLKAMCGSGGSIQDGQIELQGDHQNRVQEQLRQIGYKVR